MLAKSRVTDEGIESTCGHNCFYVNEGHISHLLTEEKTRLLNYMLEECNGCMKSSLSTLRGFSTLVFVSVDPTYTDCCPPSRQLNLACGFFTAFHPHSLSPVSNSVHCP